MTRAGRKRNSTADRKPCGRIKYQKPKPHPDQPHRKGYGSNPLAETCHGRYLLDKAITPAQHAAGTFYGRSRLRYRAAIGSPDSLRSWFEGYPSEPDNEADAKAVAEFEAARQALGTLVFDIDWVVCLDAQLADLTAYRKGLDVLRRFYGV